jgi:hypothetical protein
MNNLSFEMLKNGWDAIRTSGAPNLRKLVSGLTAPARVLIQRVAEDQETLTVVFSGFDQALDDPETEAPILKRAILAWVKNFAEAQIQRGDPDSFIIRIVKTQQQIPAAANDNIKQANIAANDNHPLVQISNVRKTHGR